MPANPSRLEGQDTQLDEEDAEAPFFSIILPTRNRPELFSRALDSVLDQSFQNFEVLVVNDGSADELLPRYRAMEANSDVRVSWHYQSQRPNGHGPSYSINTGAQSARGRYLCILDDDDSWESRDHLQKTWDIIRSAEQEVDVVYSNQSAYRADGHKLEQPLWLAALVAKLSPAQAGNHGVYTVTPAFLLGCNGFPHLNCTIIRRDLYAAIGGMDEGIRYECEVDLYLRTLDAASLIIYNPDFVARHNVPEAALQNNVSTAVSRVEKCLSQVRVYQKNIARSPVRAVRDACFIRISIVYKRLTDEYLKAGEFASAAACAKIALAYKHSLKWRLYSLYLSALSAFRN